MNKIALIAAMILSASAHGASYTCSTLVVGGDAPTNKTFSVAIEDDYSGIENGFSIVDFDNAEFFTSSMYVVGDKGKIVSTIARADDFSDVFPSQFTGAELDSGKTWFRIIPSSTNPQVASLRFRSKGFTAAGSTVVDVSGYGWCTLDPE